jgi:hypothetical protein
MNILYEMLTDAHTQVAQKVINYKNFVICGQYNELSVSSIPREYNLCGCELKKKRQFIFLQKIILSRARKHMLSLCEWSRLNMQ